MYSVQKMISGLAVAVLFTGMTTAQGQVQVGISLPRRSYMVGETITARIAIQSQSAVPLVFGKDYHNAEMFLEVGAPRSGRNLAAERKRVQRDLVIMPGMSARDVIELTSLYEFLRPGNYRVLLVVRLDGVSYTSDAFAFDVERGIEMTSLRHMIQGYAEPAVLFSLRYTTRDGREDAFMVIKSAEGESLFGTFSLGPLLRIYNPMIRLRPDGTVAVIHQSGINRFTRSIFAVDRSGADFVEQRHFRPDGTPLE